MLDGTRVVHANGFTMSVALEDLATLEGRVLKETDGKGFSVVRRVRVCPTFTSPSGSTASSRHRWRPDHRVKAPHQPGTESCALGQSRQARTPGIGIGRDCP